MRERPKYGDKRDYRKIDIIVNGSYKCSTTWARTLKEAKERWLEENCKNDHEPINSIRAVYSEKR